MVPIIFLLWQDLKLFLKTRTLRLLEELIPILSYCITPLEIIIDFKDKRLFYSLILDDYNKKDVNLVHDIVNIYGSFATIEDEIIKVFENEKFGNGKTLLDYLIENNFILFESTGSYLVDEGYADSLYKRYYNCDLEDNIPNTSLERSFIKYSSIYNN